MTDKRIRIILDSKEADKKAKVLDDSVRGVGRSADISQESVNALTKAINDSAKASLSADKKIDRLSDEVKGLGNNSQASERKIDNLSRDVSRLGDESVKSARDSSVLDRNIDKTGKSSDSAAFAVKRLASAIAGAFATQKVIQYADAFTNIENQIRRTVDTQEDLIRTTSELLSVSNDTRSSLSATTALYTSLSISTKSLGTSQKDVIGVTKTINNLFLEAGKSAAETEGAIRQLGQALESGTLRGDEFNSVAEGAPGILRAIEQQTGKTRAELRELAADGEITAELLVSSLQSYEGQAQKAADATRATFGQSLVVAENNAIAFVGALSLVQEATGLAGSAIVTVSENLDVLVKLAGAAAAVYVARLIPSIIQSGVAFSQQAAAALRTTTVLDSYGKVISRTTALTRASTVAVRGLTAAMSLLGGPAGIAFLAIAALTTYAVQAEAAASANEVLAESTDNLTRAQADNLNLKTRDALNAELDRIDSLNTELNKLTALYDNYGKRGGQASRNNERDQARVADQIERTKIELALAAENADKLGARLEKVSTVISDFGADQDPFGFGSSDPFAVTGSGTGNADTIGDDGSTSDTPSDDSVTRAKSTTAALQRELDARKEISAIYRQGELDAMASQFEQERAMQSVEEQVRVAEAEAKYAEDSARREERFLASLENDAIENEQKKALKTEFENQNLIAGQLLQQELTAIEQRGAKDREKIAKMEMMTKIDTWSSMASSGLAILQSFGSKSFQSQKNFAIADGIINIASGVAKALNNPYPANLAFAAQVGLQGAALIKTIKSTKPGSGGGSVPSVSASAPPASATASAVQPQQQSQPTSIRIVVENDPFEVGTKINNALKDLQKNGVEIAGASSR
jgi:tape measure domain-containing protein